MNITDIIKQIKPDADMFNDVKLQNDGQGTYIAYWNEDKLGAQPTIQELLDKIPELQAQHDLNQVLIQRKAEYPSTDELLVALWEKQIEGRPEAADALEAKRQAVKTKYPKVK